MLDGYRVLLVEFFERRGQDPSLLEGSARRREVLTPSRTVDLILHDTSTRRTVSLETHTNSDMSALALRVKESLHEAVRPLSIMTVGTGRTGPLLPKTGVVRDALVAGSELPRPFAYITSFYALVGGGKRARDTLDCPAEVVTELKELRTYCADHGFDAAAGDSAFVAMLTKLLLAAVNGDPVARKWAGRITDGANTEAERVGVLKSLLSDGDSTAGGGSESASSAAATSASAGPATAAATSASAGPATVAASSAGQVDYASVGETMG
jgi:hypothetical protein